MKIHLTKIFYNCIFTLVVGIAVLWAMPTAAMPVGSNAADGVTYENCVTTPEIKSEKSAQYVRDYQLAWAKSLVKAGFQVEMMRSREVLVIVIPTNQLFKAGTNELSAKGARRLQSVVSYLGNPGFYRVVVAGYTDNTGSPTYCLRRSDQQATVVADWLRGKASGCDIYNFGLGNESPLLPNNTVANRAANRRIEILLVPGEGLIGKSGK